MGSSSGIRVVSPLGSEVLEVLGGTMIVKADGEGIPLFIADHPVPPGYAVPLHRHLQDDEIFYILEGELTLLDGTGERRAGPGSCVHLPRGSLHGFRNDTEREVRFLVICQPGRQAIEMFRDFDRAAEAAPQGLPPATVAALASRHGLTLA
ncbi:MAG: cupin domain-containing protein [Dongiaceae bacterium]